MTMSNLAKWRWRAAWAALGCVSLVPSCNGRAPREPVDPSNVVHDLGDAEAPFEPALTEASYAELAARGDVHARFGDIVVLCAELPDRDAEEAFDGEVCRVHRIGDDGELVDLGITHAESAQRLTRSRLLVTTWQGELDVIYEDGRRATLARDVLEPHVDATGHRVVLLGRPVGVVGDPAGPGGSRLLRFDVDTGAVEVLLDGLRGGFPIPLPDGDRVLFVSDGVGVPAFWLASARGAPEQLTNVDVISGDHDTTPVLSSRRHLLVDGRTLLFVAEYESDVLWSLDVQTGEIARVGAGALPMFLSDGSVVAGGGYGNEGADAEPHVVLSGPEGGA